MAPAISAYFLLALVITIHGIQFSGYYEEVHFYTKFNYSNENLTTFPEIPYVILINNTFMDVGENRIQRLEEDFMKNEKLMVLRLQNNEINFIHRNAFRFLRNLMVLQLPNNKIRELCKDTFISNKRLTWLDLSNNQIVLMSPFLISLSLRRLDLCMNNLDVIPDSTFEQLDSLTYLSLSYNNLHNIPEKAVTILKHVANLTIEGNSLTCDCQLVGGWKWGHTKILINEHILCDSPFDMKDKSWERVSELECKDETIGINTYLLFGITTVLFSICLLIVLLTVWLLRRRRDKKKSPAIITRKRTPVLIGEYIEVMPENEPKQNEYETVNPNPEERYVTEMGHNSYLIPAEKDYEEPIYVNLRGPPLPRRPQENNILSQPVAPAPPAPIRRCSVPLLDGCDFFEVVE